jgi:orotate phosphoribosyltransferase
MNRILDMKSIMELRLATDRYVRHGNLADEEFDHIFRLCDALWLHSGNAWDPHAELTSGKCSDGFVDVLRVLRYSFLCEMMARLLIAKLPGSNILEPDWVIGSDHAGAALSHSVALQLKAMHDFTEKGPDQTQVWKRFEIQPDESVLRVEELVTTTGTLQAVSDGLRRGNPHPIKFVPVVMTLVHRSDVREFEGAPILFLRHYDIQTWDPKDCPLCAQGSKRLKPKQNWTELTRR